MNDKRKETDGKALAAAVGMLALLVLASAARRPAPKPTRYDWMDHVGGISLVDKLMGDKR